MAAAAAAATTTTLTQNLQAKIFSEFENLSPVG
jgi:hypothetical protein